MDSVPDLNGGISVQGEASSPAGFWACRFETGRGAKDLQFHACYKGSGHEDLQR